MYWWILGIGLLIVFMVWVNKTELTQFSKKLFCHNCENWTVFWFDMGTVVDETLYTCPRCKCKEYR